MTSVYGDQVLTLPFTAPIYDPFGNVAGIWHNEASFERVVSDIMVQRREAFAEQGLTEIETQILRADGTVLDDVDSSVVFELNLADAGLEAAVLATGTPGSTGHTVEDHLRSGVEQINGYAVTDGALGFDGYGWGVLVRQASQEAAAPALALRNSLALIGALVVAVTMVAGLWLARSLSKPLKVSARKLDEVSAGDLSVRFDVRSGDEVGQMSAALNSALSSIGGTMAQVDHSATDLTRSAGNLTSLSREMAGAANHTSSQATEVAAAAGQIASSSNSVAGPWIR